MLSEEHVAWQHVRAPRARLVMSEKALSNRRISRRLNELKPHPQRPCRDFCSRQHVLFRAFAEGTWQPEDSDLADPRNGLREQFQTLADELRARLANPVTLPPGRARLVTSPLPTGSAQQRRQWGGFWSLAWRPGRLCVRLRSR
jgi:hypothetical protein